jgi:NAD dependent epimerase/dehydratase
MDWSNKRVLITGADGFIGSHLCEALVADGARVRAFVYYNSWNSIGWLGDCQPETLKSIEVFAGDIRDPARVAEACADIEYVFHLSSLIAIPYSYVAAHSYVDTNVTGALNVLEAARRSGSIERVVHTSTSEVYGTAQYVPIDEAHPLVGQSPYSASKIGADMMAESYFRSHGVPVSIARPFNTFGPRQTPRAVIPTIARQLLQRCESLRLGALSPTRDFNFVTDTCAGLLAIAASDKTIGKTLNIGTGEEWSIEQTATILMDITGHHPPIECEEQRLRPEKSEVNRLLANADALRELTGWAPATTFEHGLTAVANWVESHMDQLAHASDYAV